ncbi:MAG: hypothetical protein LBK99_06465 [Opitutaceae bacterium]|jgi:hypothetical protein|nr:hypothetical protein [Opitutaceae bacterium]
MQTGSSSTHTLITNPDGIAYLDTYGTYIQIVRSTTPLSVKIDEQAANTLTVGQGIHTPEPFARLVFRTPSGTPATFDVWVGFSEFIDHHIDQIEAPTIIVSALPTGELAGKASHDLDGAIPTQMHIRRRMVTISNMDPSVPLFLRDRDNRTWGVVRAGETISHNTSGFVRIANDASAAVSCHVAETWYVNS